MSLTIDQAADQLHRIGWSYGTYHVLGSEQGSICVVEIEQDGHVIQVMAERAASRPAMASNRAPRYSPPSAGRTGDRSPDCQRVAFRPRPRALLFHPSGLTR
jgi:hypothetical protein